MDLITLALAKSYSNKVGSTIQSTSYNYDTGELTFNTINGDWTVPVNNGMNATYKQTLDNIEYSTTDNKLKINGSVVVTQDDLATEGGGDSSITLTQEEYEALTEEEKLNGLYYIYDTKKIYKNGVQYGISEPIQLTIEEYKALKEAGAIDEQQDYLVKADTNGILLGAEDIVYSDAKNGIQATTVQGAIDKIVEKTNNEIAEIERELNANIPTATVIKTGTVSTLTVTDKNGTTSVDIKDGKSISSIAKDDDNNIIVTFTDGTTQNIGKLSVDIQGDFLTSDGFGNLRYYNDKFQYYNTSTSTWVDIEATTNNKLIVDLSPQPMQKMQLLSDIDNKCYKIVFKEPEDTIVNGQLLVAVEGIKFVRKLNSAPTSIDDGELVLDYTRRNFGKYGHKIYLDTNFSPVAGENWYYKAFPYSSNGMINNSSANVANCIFKDYYLYGFKLDQTESDPASMITYLDDCDNVYFEPAYMNYATNTFNYGDWGDVWFIKNLKPCMLKYDGTVDYELDKNDYTKKTDGTASDVANDSYGGNAMIGIPKVYWKIVDNGDNTANIYFSDKQIDIDFHCWSHIDNNGNEIDYCYMPIYNGSNVNSVLRSISGKIPMVDQTATTEITYAKSNNIGSDIIWYTELFNDRMLINLLLLLIGKSTDTQTIFGTGNNNSYVSTSDTGIKNTGTMNTKGLFWGNQDNISGVKIFGMENWYGNIWRRIGGWINDNGIQKIKMTYGQSDSSTIDGYNETGNGYISINGATPSGTNSGYISKMLITNNGLIPTIASGSATTYYCDGLWFNNSQVDYAFVGGRSSSAFRVGALCSVLSGASSLVSWAVGAALSCKPLATT